MSPICSLTMLDNGIRVASYSNKGIKGAAIAIHVLRGAMYDPLEKLGISHYVEHLLFKGTKKRSYKEIANDFESIGAIANAHTCHDGVAYYATSLYENIPDSFNILCDMFLNSTFCENEIETERNVITEEIKQSNDDPGDFLFRRFCEAFWHNMPLGRPIAGTHETVKCITKDDLIFHVKQNYLPTETLITAAGNINHRELVSMVRDQMGSIKSEVSPSSIVQQRNDTYGLGEARHNLREMEQVQFYLGYPSVSHPDNRTWTMRLLNSVLGNGVSSRLNQNIRELKGLAYNVCSTLVDYTDYPAMLIYAGCSKDKAQEVIDKCHSEVVRLTTEFVSSDTLDRVKRYTRSNLLLSQDAPLWLAQCLANNISTFNKPRSVEEALLDMDAVSPKMIIDLANDLFLNTTPRLESIGPDIKFLLPV